jgi:hypothetical protein
MRPSRFFQFLDQLALPNLSLWLVLGQVAVFALSATGQISEEVLWLVPARVLAGEWWRVVAFLFVPPAISLIFIAFAWYLFWLMGTSLEGYWGTGRYNLFLLIGWVLTVGVSFLTPMAPASNGFIAGSVFLAFAWLNPNFELAIFFVLPVKIKWLALLTWLGYAFAFVVGGWSVRLAVLASTGNFLLFFGRDIWQSALQHRRRMAHQTKTFAATDPHGPRHRCRICGKDSDTHRELDFRYCSKCAGEQCYCPEHIRNHEHVVDENAAGKG